VCVCMCVCMYVCMYVCVRTMSLCRRTSVHQSRGYMLRLTTHYTRLSSTQLVTPITCAGCLCPIPAVCCLCPCSPQALANAAEGSTDLPLMYEHLHTFAEAMQVRVRAVVCAPSVIVRRNAIMRTDK
jgi:hypothetical protein